MFESNKDDAAADRAALAGRSVMLNRYLAQYVDQQRSLGFKFRVQKILLRGYVAFAEELGDRHIKSTRVLEWAAHAPSPEQRRNRLLTVRRFALAMRAENPRHQVPAADAFGHAVVKRRSPYIYSADEIARLLRASGALQPKGSTKAIMYATLFGTLAATGMRIAEVLALQIDDVIADGLVVRETKFQKSRLLPLHATARQALDRYLVAGGGWSPRIALSSYLSPADLCRTTPCVASFCCSSIAPISGAHTRGETRVSTICATLSRSDLWRSAATIALRSIDISLRSAPTYLGHAHVTDTYWYLQATPALMGQIAEAGEALLRGMQHDCARPLSERLLA
jgi:integrase